MFHKNRIAWKILFVIFFQVFFVSTISAQCSYTGNICASKCVKTGSACIKYVQKEIFCGWNHGGRQCGTWEATATSCNCSACGTCCVPVACKGCTPAIPAGYTSTNNGCSVTITRSCTGNNGCGKSCTITRTRWLIETNQAETQPTSLTLTINDEPYTLSTDLGNPTKVKYPSLGTSLGDVKISIPSRTPPPSSDGLGYHFRANNYGINNQWIAYTDCTNPRPEDFCSESTTNIQNFQPSSMNILDVLKQNAQGKLSGLYYTVNRCDSGKIYSLPIETYYEVNNNPNVDPNDPDPTPNPLDICDWDSSILASHPDCFNPNDPTEREEICSMEPDQDCTKKEFFTNVGTSESTSLKGCNTEEYTGGEVNNPLRIRFGGIDPDGSEEIKGAIVWFSKSGTTPEISSISDTYTSTNSNEVGIMIAQNNGSWGNTPKIYAMQTDNTWGLIGDGVVKNGSGDSIAKVLNIQITQGDELVTFEFDLLLESNHTGNMDGMYQFKSIILDEYMLLDSNRVDQSYLTRHFNWGIDLVDPIMERVTTPITIKGATEVSLHLEIDGTGSNITDYVLSGYRDGGDITSRINLVSPLLNPPSANDSIALRTGSDYPQGCLPGVPSGNDCALNTWHFPNINIENYATPADYIHIDISQNQGGAVVIYATAYDQACNDSIADHVLDLRPWIATKGGVMYSQGSMGSNAKDFSEEGDLNKFYNINPVSDTTTLRNYSGQQILNEMTTGTELISSRNQAITDLIHSADIKAVRANNIYDSNEKKNYWFEYFKRKLDQQLAFEDTPIIQTTIAQGCPTGATCAIYSDESIDIPEGYVCDAKTLIMSGGNIRITPDIESSGGGLNGCIFLAKNRIIIEEGTHLSTGEIVQYDYIEGFFIAEDQILIEQQADLAEPIRDGLEVKGGLVAFGRESTNSSALLIQRNLRLFSYMNPTLVVTWDLKYAKLSEIFFGVEAAMYKQEVGFKAF